MPAPIIWPLRSMNKGDRPALQAALLPKRMFQPVFMQQRPRSTARLLAPEVPVNYPWNSTSSRFGITDIQTDRLVGIPSVVRPLPIPAVQFKITGVTRDSTGAPLGNCVVMIYDTVLMTMMSMTTSDANGNYSLFVGQRPNYCTAYKAGSPDVAGTTVNTLTGS